MRHCLYCVGIVVHDPLHEREDLFELAHLRHSIACFHIFNSSGAVYDYIHYFVGMRDGGVCDMFVPKLQSVGQTLTLC